MVIEYNTIVGIFTIFANRSFNGFSSIKAMSFFESFTDPLSLIYLVSAVFGCTMMILQLLLLTLGLGGMDGDVDADGGDMGDGGDADGGDGEQHVSHASSADIFKVLSIRTIVAALAFFGLGGLIGLSATGSKPLSVVLAVGFGLIAMYVVYYLYLSIARLKSDGSISEKTLVGCMGNVYVRIPGQGKGSGKVLVTQQERTMEYEAITPGDELKTGTPIIVVRIVSPTTVEVKAATDVML